MAWELALIVTGSTIPAEREDRPLAYGLRERILATGSGAGDVVVCGDLWYLNHDELRAIPTIAIGAPERNALAAYWGDKLPSLLAVEGLYVVQGEPDFDPPLASLWGRGAGETRHAVGAFAERYLEAFVAAARSSRPQ